MTDFSNYLQGQITKKKIEKGLEILHRESPAELRRRIQNVDINEVLAKLNEYDKNRLRELGINVAELKDRVSESDIQKIRQVLGRDGDLIIKKIRNLLQ
ncbi:MAG: V-type ATPase 116kDa subunit family protein [Clostridiaceae bacterium]|nr:V-type ATPase 116kDa subunit family protein [Clostridiaceae bacterium]